FAGHRGPASTHTRMHVWDLALKQGAQTAFNVPDGWNTALIVLSGSAHINGSPALQEGQMAVLSSAGRGVQVEADSDSLVLLLSGEPIDEPVVGYGPFVMNTRE